MQVCQFLYAGLTKVFSSERALAFDHHSRLWKEETCTGTTAAAAADPTSSAENQICIALGKKEKAPKEPFMLPR